LSHPSGVVPIAGRQVLATGSHQPSGQFGTSGAWQLFVTGSHHEPLSQSARLTAGVTAAVNAIGTNAATAITAARCSVFTVPSLDRSSMHLLSP
jgi:hypothetical protein